MPAASATLLQSHGVKASEKQMARLCFTREHGTNWLGLYHGLAVKLKPRGLRPVLFDEKIEQLRKHRGPQIISCELTEETAQEHPRLKDEWGWIVDVKHAVVLVEIDQQTVRVADPANGLEVWSLATLQLLWDGRGARVEPIPGYQPLDKPVTASR